MFAEERKQQILGILQRAPAVRVGQLGRALRVSVASIRRDLADLERSGFLKRTHGGAVSNRLAAVEPSPAAKEDRCRREKAAIAALAAQLVEPGATVFLDSGSTTRAIALELRHRRGITVVTNALDIACELASSDLDLIIIGGQVRSGILSQVGPIAERAIGGLRADKLFLAANGIDLERGVTTPSLAEAHIKRAMVEHARHVILVADHTKFGRVTFGHICDLDRVHAVVTDDGLPRRVVAAVEQRGVKVHLARVRAAAQAATSRKGRS